MLGSQIENNKPVNLMDYIGALGKALGKEAKKEFLPMQPGDVPDTWANVDDLVEQFDYKPTMIVEQGVANFADWFNSHYLKNCKK